MTYQEIDYLLKSQGGDTFNNSLNNVNDCLQKILAQFDIKALVDSLLSDKNYLEKIASLSYSHGLGFDKIIIVPYGDDNNYQLRFNIWWNNSYDNTEHYEDIHNHRWDFSTVVLKGSYKYENYRVDKNGKTMFHYFYYPIKNGNYTFNFQGEKKISVFASGTLNENEFMSVSSDILHRVIPLPSLTPTFTLFLTSKPKTIKTSVYSDKLLDKKISNINKPSISISDLKTKLTLLTKLI